MTLDRNKKNDKVICGFRHGSLNRHLLVEAVSGALSVDLNEGKTIVTSRMIKSFGLFSADAKIYSEPSNHSARIILDCDLQSNVFCHIAGC